MFQHIPVRLFCHSSPVLAVISLILTRWSKPTTPFQPTAPWDIEQWSVTRQRSEKCPVLLQFLFLLLSSWDFLRKHPGNSHKPATQESQRGLRIKTSDCGHSGSILGANMECSSRIRHCSTQSMGMERQTRSRFSMENPYSWDSAILIFEISFFSTKFFIQYLSLEIAQILFTHFLLFF